MKRKKTGGKDEGVWEGPLGGIRRWAWTVKLEVPLWRRMPKKGKLVQRCVSVMRRRNVSLVSQGVKCEGCNSDHLALWGPCPFQPTALQGFLIHLSMNLALESQSMSDCGKERREEGRKEEREGWRTKPNSRIKEPIRSSSIDNLLYTFSIPQTMAQA